MTSSNRLSGRRRWVVLAIAGLVIVLALTAFVPPNIENLSSQRRPVESYAQAVQRIEMLQAGETSALNPRCRLKFMTHGQKVERAIIFVHGYTLCPQMFEALGKKFYDLGYNVLIPPLPHHGLADRLNTELAQLTAEELADYADQVADIAQGLGEHVTMVGLSLGGVATGWAAQHRSDLDSAVLISPIFGIGQIPSALTVPAVKITLSLPNSFQWFDPDLKEAGSLPYNYPRFSTHALAQVLRFGIATQASIRRAAPAARAILVITNANDTSVDNAVTASVVSAWQNQGVRDLRTFTFDANLKLGHDLIDPAKSDQRTDVVYPKLIELITAR